MVYTTHMIELFKRTIPYIKVAFFFPFCWVVGGTLVLTILFKLGVESPWPYLAYFSIGIAGTIWFARS